MITPLTDRWMTLPGVRAIALATGLLASWNAHAEYGPDFVNRTDPFFAAGDRIFNNRIAGEFWSKDAVRRGRIERHDDHYVYYESVSNTNQTRIDLATVGGRLYFDVTLPDGHFLARVDQLSPMLKLSVQTRSSLDAYLAARPYVVPGSKEKIVTAEQWSRLGLQQIRIFLKVRGKDKELFTELIEFTRAKPAMVEGSKAPKSTGTLTP